MRSPRNVIEALVASRPKRRYKKRKKKIGKAQPFVPSLPSYLYILSINNAKNGPCVVFVGNREELLKHLADIVDNHPELKKSPNVLSDGVGDVLLRVRSIPTPGVENPPITWSLAHTLAAFPPKKKMGRPKGSKNKKKKK
jgi:hypothetical protein